jgi:hypothetical protein
VGDVRIERQENIRLGLELRHLTIRTRAARRCGRHDPPHPIIGPHIITGAQS